NYYDATGILRTSDTDLATNNTATTLSFSTTIFRMIIGTPSANPDCGNGNSSTIAHLLIQQANGSNPTGFDFRGTANYVSDPSNCTADDGATVNGIKTGATSVAFGTVSANSCSF